MGDGSMAPFIDQSGYGRAAVEAMASCTLCPRGCGVDRWQQAGACGERAVLRAARAGLHFWEEPCISGTRGSGAVFFSGCPLGCVYCQNGAISRGGVGQALSPQRLGEVLLELQSQGDHNINLVTPMHFTPLAIQGLESVRSRLEIPVVVNTGGYERAEAVAMWDGLCDVWLPDLKYCDAGLSAEYSGAGDYFARASAAILDMHRQQPELQLDGEGMIRRGLVVRHLVLPGAWRDSLAVIDWLAASLPAESFLLSLMGQYTPVPGCAGHPQLGRRVTTLEYQKVLERAREHGLQGYRQGRAAAGEGFVPSFDLSGL